MWCPSNQFEMQLNQFFDDRVTARKNLVENNIRQIVPIVNELLRHVESEEPRFISSLNEVNGRYEGLTVVSPTEFQVVLHLNQMGIFNFIDDGSIPGCAVLKLSDGRKRSMSLWVEFITASGYLSARKIRSRFQTLVAQAREKCSSRASIQLFAESSDVRLRIREKFLVHIIPAFRCAALWPRSAAHWPLRSSLWPSTKTINEVKNEGFNLLSKESIVLKEKASGFDGDVWLISFTEAEDRLLRDGTRRKCLSLLKTLRDRHFDAELISVDVLKSLVLFECEKHPNDNEWSDHRTLVDRLNGILLQLISCLQCRKCQHYFLPQVDLFKDKASIDSFDQTSTQCWHFIRQLLINRRCFDQF